MIFILKDLQSKIIIIIFNKSFDIVRKIGPLINAINNFILFRYFEIIEKIIKKNKYIKA